MKDYMLYYAPVRRLCPDRGCSRGNYIALRGSHLWKITALTWVSTGGDTPSALFPDTRLSRCVVGVVGSICARVLR